MNSLTLMARDYLALRRSLGFKMIAAEYILRQFLAFMEQQRATHIKTDAVLRWVHSCDHSPTTKGGRFTIVRKFAEYAHALDETHEIPAARLVPNRTRRTTPYIYSQEQTLRILQACWTIPPEGKGLRRSTYYTVLGLLAVTGMRISEAISLRRDDIDLRAGIVMIRESKFNNTRAIPVHASTVSALADYVRLRDAIYPDSDCTAFFFSDRGDALTPTAVRATFVRISHHIGLRQPDESHGPRIHDLRHTFAVRTVMRWYREGADVEQRLPLLSTYLGHVKPSNTYWYLSSVPELVGLAATRLETYQGGRR